MRYVSLQDIYDFYPPIATLGQSDESLRRLIERAEDTVDADLRRFGFEVPINDQLKNIVKELVIYKVMEVVFISQPDRSLVGYANTLDSIYRIRLRDVVRRLEVSGAGRREVTDVPVVGKRQSIVGDNEGLLERVRRWLT